MKTITFKAVWLEFPKSGASGGWSRSAKHRPQPVRVEKITKDVIFTAGKTVLVDGQRKLKVNLFNASTGEVIRADYPPSEDLTAFGLNTRQLAAAKRKADKAAVARRLELARLDTEDAARIASARAAMPKDVQGWIAAGCPQPAPAEIVAAKQSSGLSWSQFSKGGAL